MKFSQIKIGERFMWEGEVYVKTTPLIANHVASGTDKMVPRYANLQLAEARAHDSKEVSKPEALLNYLVDELTQAIDTADLSDEAKAIVKGEIDRVKQSAANRFK